MQYRDRTADIGKGIAIILMCAGHSYVCPTLNTFIYLFHMAFFFMMSGWFFREKNLDSPRLFVWKRIKGLWWPFMKWALAFVLLHNVFNYVGINTPASVHYTLKDMAWRIFTTNTRFIPTEECMGPYWFLSSLFRVSLFSFAVFYATKWARRRGLVRLLAFTAFYALGFVMLYRGSSHTDCIRTFVVSFVFYLGYLLGTRFKGKVNYSNPWLISGSFALLCAGVIGGGKSRYPN